VVKNGVGCSGLEYNDVMVAIDVTYESTVCTTLLNQSINHLFVKQDSDARQYTSFTGFQGK